MTDTPDAASRTDEDRLREILVRTRQGLRDDLDDLRSQLQRQFDSYEAKLDEQLRDHPSWLEVPAESLRVAFELDAPPRVEGTLIGPRCLGFLAGDLEEFVAEWIGDNDAIRAWQIRDDQEELQRLYDDLGTLRDNIDATGEAVDKLADEGPLQLEQILESIVFELESRRETDVEALESLIQDGDVAPGRDARAEIAELWEEQRQRVDRLRDIWDRMLNLHHEGVTSTLEGLGKLEELVERTREGIRGAGLADPRPGDSNGAETEQIDTEQITAARPQRRTPESSTEMRRSVETPASGEQQPTIPAADPTSSPPGETTSGSGEFGDTSEQPDAPDPGPAAVDDELSGEDTSHRPPPEHSVPDSEHAGETTPLAAPEQPPSPDADPPPASPLSPTTRRSEQSEHREPDTASSSRPSDEQRPTREVTEPQKPVGRDTAAAQSADPAPDSSPQAPDSSRQNGSAPQRRLPEETIRIRTYRMQQGWQVVPPPEIAATIGPPAVFVAGLLVMCLLSLADLAPNPMVTWQWALPASFGAMALLIALPLYFRWRPMWDGLRFRIIRHGVVEQQVDLQVTDDGQLTVDRTGWPLDQLRDNQVYRVESNDDTRPGALLRISPPYHSPIHLLTARANIDEHADTIPAHDIPEDAWRVPGEKFDAIRRLLNTDSPG